MWSLYYYLDRAEGEFIYRIAESDRAQALLDKAFTEEEVSTWNDAWIVDEDGNVFWKYR